MLCFRCNRISVDVCSLRVYLQIAKDSSVEKVIGRLSQWYMEKEGMLLTKLALCCWK